MTSLPSLPSLISRLERASGPDRELDGAIAEAIGAQPDSEGAVFGCPGWPPSYTASLDAAVTLVPDGQWGGTIMWNFGELHKGGFVELNLANPEWLKPDCDPAELNAHAACVDSYEDQEPDKHAPRPLAIALCIAALRAVAAVRERQG